MSLGEPNSYAFVNSLPTQFIDPSGKVKLQAHEISWTFGAVIYTGAIFGYVESDCPCTQGKTLCKFFAIPIQFGLATPIDVFSMDVVCENPFIECADADSYAGYFAGVGSHAYLFGGGSSGIVFPLPGEGWFCESIDVDFGFGAAAEASLAYYWITDCE